MHPLHRLALATTLPLVLAGLFRAGCSRVVENAGGGNPVARRVRVTLVVRHGEAAPFAGTNPGRGTRPMSVFRASGRIVKPATSTWARWCIPRRSCWRASTKPVDLAPRGAQCRRPTSRRPRRQGPNRRKPMAVRSPAPCGGQRPGAFRSRATTSKQATARRGRGPERRRLHPCRAVARAQPCAPLDYTRTRLWSSPRETRQAGRARDNRVSSSLARRRWSERYARPLDAWGPCMAAGAPPERPARAAPGPG